MNEDKYSLYAAWINESDPVCIWTYQPDWKKEGDEGRRIVDSAISLAADMLKEFYKGTDTNVFGLITVIDESNLRSEVRIIGEDNAFFMSKYGYYDTYKKDDTVYTDFRNWFEVYIMKDENIPKIKSLLDDWKLLFLANESFDEFKKIASEMDTSEMTDFLKRYPDKVSEDVKEKILEEFPDAYASAEYSKMLDKGDKE